MSVGKREIGRELGKRTTNSTHIYNNTHITHTYMVSHFPHPGSRKNHTFISF